MNFIKIILFNISDFFSYLSEKAKGLAITISPTREITLSYLEKNDWKDVKPCFVLSTGRCGTKTLNRLLAISNNSCALHSPHPELIRASKKAYEEIYNNMGIYTEVIKSCREELILYAVKRNKIFIETNNRITFFAPAIKKAFPNAIFIHLIRHPGDFVRSGIRRKWYTGNNSHDIGRIKPTKKENSNNWKKYSNIKKIGWLWNETNKFIENFTSKNDIDCLQIKAEELFNKIEISKSVFDFIGLEDFNRKQIKYILKKPKNKQHKENFPHYQNWNDNMKNELKEVVPLAKKYGYKL